MNNVGRPSVMAAPTLLLSIEIVTKLERLPDRCWSHS